MNENQCRHRLAASVLAAMFVLGTDVWAEEYHPDPDHSRVAFTVQHLGIAHVTGEFTNFTGTIRYDANNPEDTHAEGSISVDSIDTGVDKRDKHLLTADFFDAETYPNIQFKLRQVEQKDGTLICTGDLTMHGSTHTLKLPVTLKGPIEDPWGKQRIGLHAETTINRHEHGVGSDKPVDRLVGDEVEITIDVEATP